jgi:quinol monooxygenase YgiN
VIEPTRQELGCIQYELLENPTVPTHFVLLEEWETQAVLDAHSAARHIKTAEALINSLLAKSPPDVRFYQLLV